MKNNDSFPLLSIPLFQKTKSMQKKHITKFQLSLFCLFFCTSELPFFQQYSPAAHKDLSLIHIFLMLNCCIMDATEATSKTLSDMKFLSPFYTPINFPTASSSRFNISHSVSYTHLDVYKRQLQYWRISEFFILHCPAKSGSSAPEIRLSPISVS